MMPRQANGMEIDLWLLKLITVNMHGLGWNPNIRWYEVWSCHVDEQTKVVPL